MARLKRSPKDKAINRELGSHLAELLEQRKMTISQLAAKTKMDRSQLYAVEQGRMGTSLSGWASIAQALGTSRPDFFMGALKR